MRFSLAMVFLLFVSPCFADNFLSVLKKDQKITLRDVPHGYQIVIYKNFGVEPALFKIIEVGADYIVVEDSIGVNEIRIPIYSIKSITITKLPKVKE